MPTTDIGLTDQRAGATGLLHLRARYYAPVQGRFLSADPWGGDPNRPMSYNKWLYAYANPIRLSDPTGLRICEEEVDCTTGLSLPPPQPAPQPTTTPLISQPPPNPAVNDPAPALDPRLGEPAEPARTTPVVDPVDDSVRYVIARQCSPDARYCLGLVANPGRINYGVNNPERFSSADTTVPGAGNPQTLNRLSYEYNNPLKYTDPSGYCITRDDPFDCSIEEIEALTWDARIWWVGELGEAARSPGWFKNIQTVLAFFRDTPGLSDLNGWASASDAPLLWVIQQGYRQFKNLDNAVPEGGNLLQGAARRWAEFFGSEGSRDAERIARWGQAEILGTRAGNAYAEGKVARGEIERPGGKTAVVLREFIDIGNDYRDFLAYGTCDCSPIFHALMTLDPTLRDPRTDKVRLGIVYALGMGDQWEITHTMGEGPPLWP